MYMTIAAIFLMACAACFGVEALNSRSAPASFNLSSGESMALVTRPTDFSASFLSQVELGQSSPSLASLQRICADRDTAFIVNDSIALAKRLGADGVHLGQRDGTVQDARAAIGPNAQIGVT